jgi:glycosyltransferase involved in cell wall biosynthesis/tetratricopeptide (TPR) repeat protein
VTGEIVEIEIVRQFHRSQTTFSFETLIIVDPCVRNFVGHHLEYDEAIVQAAARAGLTAVTLGHRDMLAEVQKRIRGVRCFSHDIWKRFPALARKSPLLEVLWSNLGHFVEICLGLWRVRRMDRQNARPREGVIFVAMLTLHQLLAWSWFAVLFGRRYRPIVLQLGYEPSYYQGPGADLAFRLIEWAVRHDRARLATDSARMAQAYAHLTLAPIDVFPIPLTGRQPETPRHDAPNASTGVAHRVRFVSLGGARDEKGIFDLIAAVIELEELGKAGGISFVIQCNTTDPAIDAAIEDLSRRNLCFVELFRAPLSSDQYKALLADADVVVLPYTRPVYEARSSGVFVEAAGAGKPMIVTADTWLSDELYRFGAGTVCPERDPSALAQAILHLAAGYSEYQRAAQAKQPACLDWHSPKALIEVLMGRRAPGVTSRKDIRVGVLYPWGDILLRRAGASVRTNLMVDFLRDHVDRIRVLQDGKTPTREDGSVRYESVEIGERRPVFHWLFQKYWALACRGPQAGLPIYLWYHLRHRGNRHFRLRIDELVRWADIVMLEYPFWGDVVTPACRRHSKRLVLTHHDMMHLVATDCLPLRRALRRFDIASSLAADATVTVSEQDRQTLAALGVPSAEIRMPVDIAGLAPLANGQSRQLLRELYGIDLGTARVGLFVGSAHIPNRKAAAELRRLALSVGENDAGRTLLFVVAGSCAEPGQLRNFIALGSVDAVALQLLYEATNVVLIPLQQGLGASIKTIEAMAVGKPVIGTALGFRGYPVVSGRDCIVEDMIDRFPDRILELLAIPGRAETMGATARVFAEGYDYHRVNTAYLPLMGLPDDTAPHVAFTEVARPATASAKSLLRKLAEKIGEHGAVDPAVVAFGHDALVRHGMTRESALMLAKIDETRGNLQDALAHYTEASALDPTDFVTRLDRSRLLHRLDRGAEADAEYRRAMALHTRQLWKLSGWAGGMEVAWRFFYQSLPDEALALLQPMLRARAADGEANYLAGLCIQSRGGSPGETLAYYDRALAAGVDEFWVRYQRAPILHQLGRWVAAMRDRWRCHVLRRKDPSLPKHASGVFKRARDDFKAKTWRLFFAGKHRAVIRRAQRQLRDNPNSGEWHYLAAQALHSSRGDGRATLAHYDRALELGFDRFWVLCNRGYLRYERGDIAEAEVDLAAAVALQPDHEMACTRLALVRDAQTQGST